MSFNNLTIPGSPTIEVNALAFNIIQNAAINAATSATRVSLSSLLFGALTTLVLASIYVLISRGSVAQINGKILLLSIVLLYASTATYIAAFIWALSDGNRLVSNAVNGLSSASYDGQNAIAASEHAIYAQSTMMTLALGINFVIGDAIVWWRGCVIWQHKAITCIGVVLLTLTMIFGIVGMVNWQGPLTTQLATFVLQASYTRVSGILSLVTNIVATLLIAFKAYQHRELVKRHLGTGGTKSRVIKALALLVESGCIYCAVLIFAIVYQDGPRASHSDRGQVFVKATTDFTYGCFVPLIAIYPTIIIVLVALKRSPIDTAGLSQVRQGAQARGGHGPGTVERGALSTIVFHHTTFRTLASVGTESTVGGVPMDGPESTRSLQRQMNKEERQAVENLV